MSTVRTVREINEELARKINEEALKNPQSPYANKWVGIANGQVVVMADDLDEMITRLRQIEPALLRNARWDGSGRPWRIVAAGCGSWEMNLGKRTLSPQDQ